MSLFPMVNPAKKKLAEGGLVLCMGIRQARTVDILMVAAQCGFDSFYVDMEHSPVSHETAAALCAGVVWVIDDFGIGREDKAKMHAQHGRNYRFFDAPVGLIFTIDRIMEQGSWLDYGMFLQNIMIAAHARGQNKPNTTPGRN